MSAAELNPADVRVEVLTTPLGSFAPAMSNGVRLIHTPTGITVEETAARSAHANRAAAWERLAKLVAAAPEAPALPADVREALKEAREALEALQADVHPAYFADSLPRMERVIKAREKSTAAIARIDALGATKEKS